MTKKFKEFLSYIVIIVIVVLIRTYIITPGLVNGSSMEDTLYNKDLVLINKIGLKKGINRYDIVVVKYDDSTLIKRVIGLSNEEVKYEDNVLYINNKEVETPIKFDYTHDFEMKCNTDEYVVLGDNRNVSKDSRIIGCVSIKDIKGKVNLVLFPFKRFGKVV